MKTLQATTLLVARVSDVDQRKALPAQKKRLYEYAVKKEWIEDKDFRYVEFDETAYKENRKTFNELVIEPIVKSEKPSIVVFDKIDRFSRDSSSDEKAILIRLCEIGRLEMHFPSDNLYFNENSPASDKFRLDIGVSLAAFYSASIRDNVKRRFEQMLADGIWVHRAPVGYKNINYGTDSSPLKDIVVDKDRAHHIKKAFDLRSMGMSYAMIAKELLAAGFTSGKTGRSKLSKSDVEKIINNKFYYGVMVQKGIEYPHKYKPLINKALYNQCQYVKDGRKSMKTKYDSMDFTLKGLVRCGICGRSVSSYRNRKWVYLKCANGKCANKTTAESLVLGSVESILQRVKVPKGLVNKVLDELKNKHEDQQLYYTQSVESLRTEHKEIDVRLEEFFNQLAEGRITPETHDKIVTKLTSRQQDIDAQVTVLTNGNKNFLVNASYLLGLANRAEELFKAGDEATRSKLLGYMLSNIELNDKKLSFQVNYPFNMLIDTKEKSPTNVGTSLWCG